MFSVYPIIYTARSTPLPLGDPLGVLLVRWALVALRARRVRKAREARAGFSHQGTGSGAGRLAGV